MATTLRRELGITSLILTVVTGTIGSGWLLAPYFCARIAGPSSLLAWLLGGAMAFLLAMVFAELGSLVNSSGALAQIPLLSHGRFSGFVGGWSAWISYVALPTIVCWPCCSTSPASSPGSPVTWARPRCSVVPVS
ncbi:hypothetical protein [Synechococcus sp. NOUM97013]|uniref:hypothetical protein n=1 Tax=Synechococcus sp. NOUM97013 TaxID=1442555 RepID=UPI00186195DA|nr:Amino acid transporter [Synechococcus sp. NOUM97013]